MAYETKFTQKDADFFFILQERKLNAEERLSIEAADTCWAKTCDEGTLENKFHVFGVTGHRKGKEAEVNRRRACIERGGVTCSS